MLTVAWTRVESCALGEVMCVGGSEGKVWKAGSPATAKPQLWRHTTATTILVSEYIA
jgi:hypothetical protein